MAQDLPKDKLAQRIAQRRAAQAKADGAGLPEAVAPPPAAATDSVPSLAPSAPIPTTPAPSPSALGVLAPAPVKKFPTETFSPAQLAALKDLRDAMHLGENPLALARRLALLANNRGMRSEVAAAIDKTPSWVTKKLLLLEAPKEVQKLIEDGKLAESAYHDDRLSTKASIRGKGANLRFEREPRGKVSKTAMRNIAQMFQDIAEAHGLAPVRIPDTMSLTDLEYILNTRASEIRAALKDGKK